MPRRPRELAPEEDQGFLLVGDQDPAGRQPRLHRRRRSGLRGGRAPFRRSRIPSSSTARAASARFRRHDPEALGRARRTHREVLTDLEPKFRAVPSAQVQAFSPPALPGSTGGPPMQFVIRTTGDYRDARGRRAEDAAGGARERALSVHRRRPQVRHAAVSNSASRRQGQQPGVSMARDRGDAGDDARRQLRHLFSLYGRSYQVIPQAPRDFPFSPDWLNQYRLRAANGELVPLSAVATITEKNSAERADKLPAAQFGDAVGGAVPGPDARRGARLPQGQVGEFPRGLFLHFQGDSRQYEQEGNILVSRLRLRAGRHLSGARGAVRELPRSVHHPDRPADGAVRGHAALNIGSFLGSPASTSTRRSAL